MLLSNISIVYCQQDSIITETEESWLPQEITEYDFELVEGDEDEQVEFIDTDVKLSIALPVNWKIVQDTIGNLYPTFTIYPSSKGHFHTENELYSLLYFNFILVEVESQEEFWTEPMKYIVPSLSDKIDHNDTDLELILDGFIEKLDSTTYACEVKFDSYGRETDVYVSTIQISNQYSIMIVTGCKILFTDNYIKIIKQGLYPSKTYDSDFIYDYEVKELMKSTAIPFLNNISLVENIEQEK